MVLGPVGRRLCGPGWGRSNRGRRRGGGRSWRRRRRRGRRRGPGWSLCRRRSGSACHDDCSDERHRYQHHGRASLHQYPPSSETESPPAGWIPGAGSAPPFRELNRRAGSARKGSIRSKALTGQAVWERAARTDVPSAIDSVHRDSGIANTGRRSGIGQWRATRRCMGKQGKGLPEGKPLRLTTTRA